MKDGGHANFCPSFFCRCLFAVQISPQAGPGESGPKATGGDAQAIGEASSMYSLFSVMTAGKLYISMPLRIRMPSGRRSNCWKHSPSIQHHDFSSATDMQFMVNWCSGGSLTWALKRLSQHRNLLGKIHLSSVS